jgi:CBS domain-containing protein
MRIADIMTREVQSVTSDTDLLTVARHMRDLNVGVIPVVEDEHLVGVITDRDIVIRAVAMGSDPQNETAGDHMSPHPTTVGPDEDVAKAAQIMAREQIRRLAVVEDGKLVGILSIGDVAVDAGEDRLTGDALEQISESTPLQVDERER